MAQTPSATTTTGLLGALGSGMWMSTTADKQRQTRLMCQTLDMTKKACTLRA